MTPIRRRRIRKVLIGIAVVLCLVIFLGPRVMAPILRQRLEKMVADSLNARLTMDQLSYEFPYGVRAKNAALVAKDENGKDTDLLRVADLELALAKLPVGDGPLVIERIIAKDPVGRLVLTEHGFVGGKGLVKKDDDDDEEETPKAPAQPAPAKPRSKKKPKEKPSDYFRLRYLELQGGQIAFEDRRDGNTTPVIWKNLAVQLKIAPASGSLYSYELAAHNAPLAIGNVRGDFDIDTLSLSVAKFVLAVSVERGKPQEQLPPRLQQALLQYEVAGALNLSGSAKIPLKNPDQTRFEATLDLPSASMNVSDDGDRIDRLSLKLNVSSQDQQSAMEEVARPVVASKIAAATAPSTTLPATRAVREPPVLVHLDHLDIASGDTLLHVDKAQAIIDSAVDQWRVREVNCRLDIGQDHKELPTALQRVIGKLDLAGKMKLTATASGPLRPIHNKNLADQIDYEVIVYPRDFEIKLHKWPQPFTNASGIIRASPKAILFQNVEFQYQADKFFVTSARIPMADIEKEVRIEEIVGSMQLSGKVLDYPKPFEPIAVHVRPAGTFYAIGNYARKVGLPPGEKPDYRLNIRCDQAGATLTNKDIPVTGIKAEIVAATHLVELKRLEGVALGGTLTGEAQIIPGKGKELIYEGNAWVRDLDLKSVAWFFSTDEKKASRLSGKGNLNVHFQGTGPDGNRSALDNFTARGHFEALEGDFWSVPVINEISGSTKVAPSALTAGQAAAVFEIYDQMVHLKQAAISAPVLGVQGTGNVSFKGDLDLHAVAAPLADWKDQLKRTKIPILSDVAGELAGGIQKMLNTASQTLLYEFHVTGKANKPKIETVPAPALTDGVAKVFGAMIKGDKLGDLFNGSDPPRKK